MKRKILGIAMLAGIAACGSDKATGPPGSPEWKVVPSTTENHLLNVWGTSSSNVWAVGDRGTIVHYDGTKWSKVASGTTETLHGIWGASASNIYAVGISTVLHYDGSSWSKIAGAENLELWGVWGSSASEIWAVGSVSDGFDGALVKINGTTLTVWYATDWGHNVWGSSGSDFWVTTCEDDETKTLHYNGVSWSRQGPTGRYCGIWGTSSSDIWVVGSEEDGEFGAVEHFNGTAWSRVSIPATGDVSRVSFDAVWGSSSSDVWIAGSSGNVIHWNGTTWTTVPSNTSRALWGLWGSSASDVWAVGSLGTILHFSAK